MTGNLWWVKCDADGCSATFSVMDENLGWLRYEARKAGWKSEKREDLCPEHHA